jgi:hypothetical protein
MSKNLVTMARNMARVYDRVPDAALPSEAHRRLLAQRRRSAHLQLRYLAPLAGRVPLGLIATLKRAGVAEAWYQTPPPEVAEAYPDLAAV